ncbi:tyrosine-type recombinase/integrase [Bradyrhizobium sp. CB82]|uniref:tyrosine-type recombinase/integrase n=1 Tax=Bradyrhizobium sp. CB82 TaxID=3039159 RepID=UPI0024B27BF0|nr:site-specific integrase [Bradyrhizobium sp. CB82]WFU44202.1 tyrosine-type recombinase/integrase [Bradyrhizobium sp. CB82]
MTKALSDKRLEALEKAAAPASRQEIPDGLLPGLYLVRQPSKALSWAVRYRNAGKTRKVTIGPYPAIGLKAARELGGKALRAAAEGRDPAREKQDAKAEAKRQAAEEKRAERDLFENVAAEFMKRHAVKNTREGSFLETARILGMKRTDAGEWEETGNGVIAEWKGRKVQDITRRDVVIMVDAIVDRGAPVMANRTLAAVRKLFNWCVGRDVINASPATLIEPPAKEDSRRRVLSDDELRLIWNAADTDGWPFGPIVQLMLLTGQRENEIARMRWNELDLDNAVWTLPANRTKNDEPHTVPLSDAVVSIIKALPKIKSKDDFVFVGRHGKAPTAFSHAKVRIDDAVTTANNGKEVPAWVFHDLRRTMVSGMARLGIALPVIEKVINHKSGTFRGVVSVYQHHDFAAEKRTALTAWASHVDGIMSGKAPASNVVPMRERA